MKHFTCILFALLTIIILSSCDIDQKLACSNYCSKALYYSEFSGVVRDIETKEPINGALVILTESNNQICDTCVTLGTVRLITDARGRFTVPSGISLPDLYIMNVVIEAENCVGYDADHDAFDLLGTLSPGETFELSCS